jgi:hypothetical protein
MKTLNEWISEYRSGVNPITGEQNLFRDIPDQMIWDAAQEEIKILLTSETARADKAEKERDELISVCEKVLRIMESEGDQFKSCMRGWACGHLSDAINRIKGE